MSDRQFMVASLFMVVYWVSVIILLINIGRARNFGDMVVAIPETAATVILLIVAATVAVYMFFLPFMIGVKIRPRAEIVEGMLPLIALWGGMFASMKGLAWILHKRIGSKDTHGQPTPVNPAVRTVKVLLVMLILFLVIVFRNPSALMRE